MRKFLKAEKFGKVTTTDGLLELSLKVKHGWDNIFYLCSDQEESSTLTRLMVVSKDKKKSETGFISISVHPSKDVQFIIGDKPFHYRVKDFFTSNK